jgi:hypothetical protein
MTRTARLLLPCVALLLGAVFITVSHFRLIDGDEGFYLLAAKLVFQGKVLYSDFFYTQMPLIPFVYGSWLGLTGDTWNSARLLSAMFATALGCLLFWHVTRVTRSCFAGCLAALLFVSSTPVVVWFTVVKTYSLSALLLFGAYVAAWECSSKWVLAVSGLLFALSVDGRLYLAGVAPVLLLSIYSRRAAFPNLRVPFAWFFGGLACGASPNLYWIFRNFGNYYFNNLGYHAIRSGAGLVGDSEQKIETLLQVTGLKPSVEGYGLPFGLLLLLNAIYFVLHRKLPGPRVWPAMYIAAGMVWISVLPTPAYQQYYCLAVPFLIVGAVCFAWDLSRSRAGLLALVFVLTGNLSLLHLNLPRYTSTGVGVMGVLFPEKAIDWRLASVREVSRELDRQATPGQSVLSFWPGYVFESHTAPFPGAESHVGLSIADKLTAAQLAQYRILSKAGIEAGLILHNPCVVVLGNQQSMGVDGAPYERMLQLHGYRISYSLGHTSIYTCK